MIEVLRETILITGFVFVMMLVIEYVNVLTSGAWLSGLAGTAGGSTRSPERSGSSRAASGTSPSSPCTRIGSSASGRSSAR